MTFQATVFASHSFRSAPIAVTDVAGVSSFPARTRTSSERAAVSGNFKPEEGRRQMKTKAYAVTVELLTGDMAGQTRVWKMGHCPTLGYVVENPAGGGPAYKIVGIEEIH